MMFSKLYWAVVSWSILIAPTAVVANPYDAVNGPGGSPGGGTYPRWNITITKEGSTTISVTRNEQTQTSSYPWAGPSPAVLLQNLESCSINSSGTFHVSAKWVDSSGAIAPNPPTYLYIYKVFRDGKCFWPLLHNWVWLDNFRRCQQRS